MWKCRLVEYNQLEVAGIDQLQVKDFIPNRTECARLGSSLLQRYLVHSDVDKWIDGGGTFAYRVPLRQLSGLQVGRFHDGDPQVAREWHGDGLDGGSGAGWLEWWWWSHKHQYSARQRDLTMCPIWQGSIEQTMVRTDMPTNKQTETPNRYHSQQVSIGLRLSHSLNQSRPGLQPKKLPGKNIHSLTDNWQHLLVCQSLSVCVESRSVNTPRISGQCLTNTAIDRHIRPKSLATDWHNTVEDHCRMLAVVKHRVIRYIHATFPLSQMVEVKEWPRKETTIDGRTK